MIKNRKGFTLIELIIVIVILGVLAGLATPKVMESVKGSRVNALVTNAQLVSRVINQYYNENNRAIPADNTVIETKLGGKTLASMGLTYTITTAPSYTLTVTDANVTNTGLAATDLTATYFSAAKVVGGSTPTIAATTPRLTWTITAQ